MAVALGKLVRVDAASLSRRNALMQGYVDHVVYLGISTAVAWRSTFVHLAAHSWGDRVTGMLVAAHRLLEATD